MGEPWRIGVMLEQWANRVTAATQSTGWRRQPVNEVDQKQASIRGWLALQGIPWDGDTRRAMVAGIMYAVNATRDDVEMSGVAYLVNVCGCLLLELNERGEDLPQEVGEETPPGDGDGL